MLQKMKGICITLLFSWTVLLAAAQEDCGQKPDQIPWDNSTNFFIVGGRDAEVGAWPWQLSLQYFKEESSEWGHTCGAVLVEPGWALTAAHCLFGRDVPENFRLLVGGHDLNDTMNNEYFYIDQIFIHENYSQNPFRGYPNDACMLKLTTEVDITEEGVGLACIPDESFGDFSDNDECWISGWGLTGWLDDEVPDILQEGKVPIPTNEECEESNIAYRLILQDFHVCVGDGDPSACRGDSGGPVTCLVEDTWYVAGVASFGPIFCAYWPMVYTRTTVYYEWIFETIANN